MARNRKVELLKEVSLFYGCTDKELKAIASIADEVDEPAGAVLMKEGASGSELLIVASGTAKVTKGGRKVATVGPGDAIGELALLDGGTRSATVTADTPMRVYVVARRDFSRLLETAPTVSIKLLKAMAKRLREAERSPLH